MLLSLVLASVQYRPLLPFQKAALDFSLSVITGFGIFLFHSSLPIRKRAATSVAAFGLVFSFHIRRDQYSPSAPPPYVKSEVFYHCFSSAVRNGLDHSEFLPCCLTSIFGCKCLRTLVGGEQSVSFPLQIIFLYNGTLDNDCTRKTIRIGLFVTPAVPHSADRYFYISKSHRSFEPALFFAELIAHEKPCPSSMCDSHLL